MNTLMIIVQVRRLPCDIADRKHRWKLWAYHTVQVAKAKQVLARRVQVNDGNLSQVECQRRQAAYVTRSPDIASRQPSQHVQSQAPIDTGKNNNIAQRKNTGLKTW